VRYYERVHHIQRKILKKLLYAESLHYAAMRPEGVESNHFAYHLDKLLAEGLITKQDKQYKLAASGLAFVDRLSQEKMVDHLQPHIVTAIDISNDAGQTLLFKRAFQPYIHKFGFPLGKTDYGETVAAAASREVFEKTGLTDVPLVQRGIVYVEAKLGGVVISKILCHVFQATTIIAGTPTAQPSIAGRGECVWIDSTQLSPEACMPGFMAIKALLATSPDDHLFFAELSEEI
jgi:ADP-ribose pyrophosphatase YjhB (NUDIX family)